MNHMQYERVYARHSSINVQVEQNAEPAAQAVSDQGIRPAGKAVAENAEPMAKQVTDGGIRQAGQAVSDSAVPMTKDTMRGQVCRSWNLNGVVYQRYKNSK